MNLGLSGKIAAGKSTLAKAISEKFGHKVFSISTPIRCFAEAVATHDIEGLCALSEKFGLGMEYVARYIGMMHDEKYRPIVRDESGEIVKNTAFRALLQDVGTVGRKLSGDEMFWVKRAVHAAGEGPLVCDDVRLPGEKKLLESLGFAIIRLEIDRETQVQRVLKLYGENFDMSRLDHHTETALDGERFDHVLFPAPLEEWMSFVEKILGR